MDAHCSGCLQFNVISINKDFACAEFYNASVDNDIVGKFSSVILCVTLEGGGGIFALL